MELLREMPDASVDSIVTDPPYELGFMGKKWDSSGIAYSVQLWSECLRVLKHGGHLLAFSHARTYHRMVVAIEDAGFDIRDQIMWVYSSGFPKSLNISKAMTKQTGESVDKAQQWDGWGTALKPAHEPIVMARKPIEGTVANNVSKHGVGGINIDGTRVAYPEGEVDFNKVQRQQADGSGNIINNAFGASALVGTEIKTYKENGRFPANFIHDGSDEVLALFPDVKSGSGNKNTGNRAGLFGNLGAGNGNGIGGDSGSASRFFYCAKANRTERSAGLENQNLHPTVKPVALMRYLVRLVTPPNGTVLDPFAGSGTTLVATILEGLSPIGMEMTAEYLPIINGRVAWALAQHPEKKEASDG